MRGERPEVGLGGGWWVRPVEGGGWKRAPWFTGTAGTRWGSGCWRGERESKTERARGAIGGRAYKGRAPENQSKLKAVSPQQ